MLTIPFATLAGIMALMWTGSILGSLLFAWFSHCQYASVLGHSYWQAVILVTLWVGLWLWQR
jgi:formate/nitrite transporter FocA (FNT family)